MGFSGNLSTVSFGDILQLVATGNKTGALHLVRGSQEKRIYFAKGQIIFANSEYTEEDRLGQLLIRHGRLTQEQLEYVLKRQKASRKRIGELIVELRLVEPAQMREALRLQIEEIIYSLFVWGDGEFRFVDNESPPPKSLLTELNTMSVMMEGARRFDEWSEIRDSLPPANTLIRFATSPLQTHDEYKLASEDLELLALANGQRRVDEIMQTFSRGDYAAAKALHRLLSMGLVERVETATAEEQDPDEMKKLYALIFSLYSHSLRRIEEHLHGLLGAGGGQLFVQSMPKGVSSSLVEALTQEDESRGQRIFFQVTDAMPEPIRLHKVLSQASTLLRDRFAVVCDKLGRKSASHLAETIHKELAFLLAQKRVLADKYDIGREFVDSLVVS